MTYDDQPDKADQHQQTRTGEAWPRHKARRRNRRRRRKDRNR